MEVTGNDPGSAEAGGGQHQERRLRAGVAGRRVHRPGDGGLRGGAAGIRPVPFGHIGDGNVHFNLSQPVGMDPAAYLALWDEMEHLVSDIAWELGGSFSAEHGIGRLKRRALRRYKSEVELSVMRALKRILDPLDILNPGKVVDPD